MGESVLLKQLPSFFEIDLNVSNGANLFKKFEKLVSFDEGFVYFANPDFLELKYSYKKHDNYEINSTYSMNTKIRNFVFSKNGAILDENSDLISALELQGSRNKSYIVAKIAIKSTVFGIVVLGKRNENFYNDNDLSLISAASAILAYVIKDQELSNVFKIQLKALKDGIVEKNEAYETIKQQNEKILEADKAKNEFLANISHELRTPLNSILGFTDILNTQLYGNLNDKQIDYINDIKVSATHLLGMINEILDMSKLEAKAMKLVKSKFFISRALEEVSNILMPIARKKNIYINAEISEDFEVYADYSKIQQILYNLVSNAIKYSPENDTVDIAVMRGEESFKMAVHDNGIGIDKKYHGKIFAKFVQLDSAYTKKESSTGLGLTITKELVELHGGKITLISEINNGSTFIVDIPL